MINADLENKLLKLEKQEELVINVGKVYIRHLLYTHLINC